MSKITFTNGDKKKFLDADNIHIPELLKDGWKREEAPKKKPTKKGK